MARIYTARQRAEMIAAARKDNNPPIDLCMLTDEWLNKMPDPSFWEIPKMKITIEAKVSITFDTPRVTDLERLKEQFCDANVGQCLVPNSLTIRRVE